VELPQFKSIFFLKSFHLEKLKKMVIVYTIGSTPSNKGEQLEWPMKGCPNLLEGMVN
jgi:hypothetical protein